MRRLLISLSSFFVPGNRRQRTTEAVKSEEPEAGAALPGPATAFRVARAGALIPDLGTIRSSLPLTVGHPAQFGHRAVSAFSTTEVEVADSCPDGRQPTPRARESADTTQIGLHRSAAQQPPAQVPAPSRTLLHDKRVAEEEIEVFLQPNNECVTGQPEQLHFLSKPRTSRPPARNEAASRPPAGYGRSGPCSQALASDTGAGPIHLRWRSRLDDDLGLLSRRCEGATSGEDPTKRALALRPPPKPSRRRSPVDDKPVAPGCA